MAMLTAPTPEWPRRLLHIPTMTSFERTDGNKYGNDVEPSFNIISYTWGRWLIREGGPAIDVKGTAWKVPAVQSSHFSVDEITRVVKRVGDGVSYVWIDVACIDQENRAVKMDEVGKQAAIFSRAETAHVWLSQISTRDLESYIIQLEDKKIDVDGLSHGRTRCIRDKEWLDSTIELFEKLLSDPWFSSLWTLQEAWLREDAILLSREGESVSSRIRNTIAVMDLAQYAWTIYEEVFNYSSTTRAQSSTTENEPHNERVQFMLDLIQQSGLPSLHSSNAVVLYPIARFRKTRHPLDRVYAIMQIYGFRLGESAQPGVSFTLDELEDQLAEALNLKSPLYAQLLVHTVPPKPGKCWRVNPFSEAPTLANRVVKVTNQCRIRMVDSKWGYFEGKACVFDNKLVMMWQKASFAADRTVQRPVQEILLDASEFAEKNFPKATRLLSGNMDERQHSIAEKLVSLLGAGNLHVALLGTGSQHRTGRVMAASVGLLILRQEEGNKVYWHRMGICAWESEAERFMEGQEMWFPLEGLLGGYCSEE